MVKRKIIAFVGPPHSGKTIFITEIFFYLQQIKRVRFFLQRAAPDGEGVWSAESYQDIVKRIRRKGKFNPEFIEFTLNSIKKLSNTFPLVLVDCGGRITIENQMIISACTDFIIISSDKESTTDWSEFCEYICNCNCMAIFDSTLDLNKDPFFDKEKSIGLLVGLKRERNLIPSDTIEVIHKFTNYIIEQLEY